MSQLTTTSRESLVETSAGAMRYRDVGSTAPDAPGLGAGGEPEPPLVFLQGLFAPPEIWGPVVDQLSARHRCITVDWPFGAHRQAMSAAADLTPPGIARLVVEVLDALEIPTAVLIGNDSGGAISQLVIAQDPGRVASAVLMACDAFECFPPPQYRSFFRAARVPGVVGLVARSLHTRRIARSRFGFGAVMETGSGAADTWAAHMAAHPGICHDVRRLITGSSASQTLAAAERFGGFERPVLVVWAQDDRLFDLELGRRLAAAFPNGRLETVADSRTFIPHDQPTVLAGLIANHLGAQQ